MLGALLIIIYELSKHLQFLASLLICASVGNFCVCSTLVNEPCVAFHSCITCNVNILRWGQLCATKIIIESEPEASAFKHLNVHVW